MPRELNNWEKYQREVVANGWRLVPAEITLDMQRAYFDVIDKNMHRVETDPRFGRFSSNEEAYRAMIAAAPKPSL